MKTIPAIVLISTLFCLVSLFLPTKSLAFTWIRTSANSDVYKPSIISTADGHRLIYTTFPGYINVSQNSGESWIPRINAGYNNWRLVSASADGNKIIALPNQGHPKISSNFGLTWSEVTSLGDNYTGWATAASSSDGTKLIISTQDGVIYISTNSGQNWSEQPGGKVNGFTVASSSNGQVLAVVSVVRDILYLSTDYGTSWSTHSAPDSYVPYIGDISISPDGLKIIVNADDDEDIYREYFSSTSNISWSQPEPFDNHDDMYSPKISFSPNGQSIALLSGTNLFISVDSGITWSTHNIASVFDGGDVPQALTMQADASHLIITSNSGIFFSANYGDTWTRHDGGAGGLWSNISGLKDSHTIIASSGSSNSSFLSISRNAGESWERQTNLPGGVWRQSTLSSDGNHISAVTYSDTNDAQRIVGGIYTSSNAGKNWAESVDGGRAFWQSISASSDGDKQVAANAGYGCDPDCDPSGNIFTSSDYGSHWTKHLSAGTIPWSKVVISGDGNKIIAQGSNNNQTYISNDFGSTWGSLVGLPENSWFSDIAMSFDGSVILVVGPRNLVYLSLNSGTSWQQVTGLESQWWNSASMSSGGTTIVISGDSDVYTSIDSGTTWHKETDLVKAGKWQCSSVSSDGSVVSVASSEGGFLYVGTVENPFVTITETLAAQGILTNLDSYNDLTHASNIYFEKPGIAKIVLPLSADLTDPDVINWIKNLSTYLGLASNFVRLDTEAVNGILPTEAEITIYNLDFDNPKILVNGESDIGNVISNVNYDHIIHILTFSVAHFTTFTVVDSLISSSNSDSNSTPTTGSNGNSGTVFVCGDKKPRSAPNLFQINTGLTLAKLYFSPSADTESYYISFSTSPNAEKHGTGIINLSKQGVQSFTVNALKPHTTYYFKVREQNGCMPGDWSNILKINTNSQNYFKSKLAIPVTKKTSTSIRVQPTYPKLVEPVKSSELVAPVDQITPAVNLNPSPNQTTIASQQSFWQKIIKYFGL